MKTEDKAQNLSEGMRLIFNQESSMTPRSSRSSSCSSTSSSSTSSSSSSSDGSRSPSVSRRSQRLRSHGSHYSSSESSSSRSRSRSYPRCCRVSDRSRCCHPRRRRSRSNSPYPRRSYRYGRRQDSRSASRSPSRTRYYRRSRSRARSSYRRTGDAYIGRFRCRLSPSPVRYNRRRSKSPECSIQLSQKDKMELLNIARENAVKILGAEVVKLPASVMCFKEAVKNTLEPDTEERVRVDRVTPKNLLLGNTISVEDNELFATATARKSIAFSLNNAVAKPSSSPSLSESKVTSRADSVGNRKPYGQWIPVKAVSVKKR